MAKTPSPKHRDQINVRLSDLGQDIILRLQHHYGTSKSGVIELLLREDARRLGILTAPTPMKVSQPAKE